MKFNAATVMLVTVCLATTVGSQIQAKLLLDLFNTPLLGAWMISIFLLVVGTAQWLCGCGQAELKKEPVSRLLLIILHMADIATFFIATKYNSVRAMAGMQLVVVNLWQFLNSAHNRARYLFFFGMVAFLLQSLNPDRIYLLEIGSAAVYASINYYLHHYVQRMAGASQFLHSEIYASGSIAVLMAPFAWLEFNMISLENIENNTSTVLSIVLLCGLVLGYRRSGIFFNTLSQQDSVKFFIATTFFAVVITSFHIASPLLAISLILMAASAYLASQDLPQQGGSESRGKTYLLIALCTALLLFQCTMTIAAYATKPVTIESLPKTTVKHIPLNPEFEFNRLICLRKVQERVIQDIGAMLVDGKPYVYLDIPMHMNLGDVWIWHGTHVALATHGQFPLVTDKKLERNITSARTQLGSDGIALWHGGGNFGDVWRGTSLIRNDAVQQLPNNKIVFLPQSLNYTKMQNVKHDNAIFQAHNKTLFMFRDYTSLQFSLENFPGKPVKYVPDMAFANGPQTPSANPIIDVILLLRRDKEATPHQKNESLNILRAANLTFEVWDFPVLGFPVKLEKDNKTLMYNYTTIYPKQRINIPYNNRHAFMGTRTQMANRLFSRGRLVITDRLHASIISTLMGKPVIYLDNIYKKITNVRGALANQFSECTDQNLHARHVETLVQAVKLAVQIFDGSVKM